MVTKVLVIEVQDGDLDQLQDKLEGTGARIRDVETNTDRADGSLKKLADNGGAISTLDALTGGWATRIRDAAEATNLLNVNLKATRGALIATGIGAFLVILGAVVVFWDDIVEFITQANAKLEKQIALLERKAELIEIEADILGKQIELAELQGEETEELINKKIQLLQTQIAINGAELVSLEIQKERLINQALQITLLDRIREVLRSLGGGVGAFIPTIDEEESEKINAIIDRMKALQQTTLDAQIAIQQLRNGESPEDADRPDIDQVENVLEKDFEQAEIRLEAIKGLNEEIFDLEQQLRDSSLAAQEEFLNSEQALEAKRVKQKRDSQKAIEKINLAELESKDAILQAEAGLLSQFSGLLAVFGEESKGLAIASIITEQIASVSQIISATGVANAKAVAAFPLTSGQPWVGINTASAALSIATGAASAAKSIGQLGGGGSVENPSIGPGQSTPSFNIVDNNPENQFNTSLASGEIGEVFVVEGSVSNAQEARRKKVAATSF
ncbi:MAG: hypothetical protein AAGF96_05930 [Bacteroidota bacterium]